MRPTTVLLMLLAISYAAAAQSGPAPGYDSALEYAQDYTEAEATAASEDPAGYAESKTAPGAVDEEARHAAYMACWAADDVDVQHEACDAYYVPRGQENPEAEPCDCNVSSPEAFVNATQNATAAYVANATDAAEAIVADPANATDEVPGFVRATQRFVVTTALAGLDAAQALLDGLLACLGAIGAAGQGAIDGLVAVATTLGDTLQAGAQAVGDLAVGAGGLAQEAGQAIGDAAQAAGAAIADAAQAVGDAIGGLFGAGDHASGTAEALPETPVDDVADADGLLDGVGSLLS